MPFLKLRKSSTGRRLPTPDLTVRGNQIPFDKKEDRYIFHAKEKHWALSSPFRITSRFSKPIRQHFSIDEDIGATFCSDASRENVSRACTENMVERGVQVNMIPDCFNCNSTCKILITSDIDAEKRVEYSGIGNGTEDYKRFNRKAHKVINVKEAKECQKDIGKKHQEPGSFQKNALMKFAEKLKMLADGCSTDTIEPLHLKDSTYLVLKKTHEVVLVQCPKDLRANSIRANSISLSDTEDDLRIGPRDSINSIEWSPSDYSDLSPIPDRKRKTLYPAPCPAFPMEVSFPPVQFD